MFITLSINHKTCKDPEIIGKFSLNSTSSNELIRGMEAVGLIEPETGVAYTTCERIELFFNAHSKNLGKILNHIHKFKGVEEDHSQYFEAFIRTDAIKRLLEVAVGVHSINMGEMGVGGQFLKAMNRAIRDGEEAFGKEIPELINLKRLMKDVIEEVKKTPFHDGVVNEAEFIRKELRARLKNGVDDMVQFFHNLSPDVIEDYYRNQNVSSVDDYRVLVIGSSNTSKQVITSIKRENFYNNKGSSVLAITSPVPQRIELVSKEESGTLANDIELLKNIREGKAKLPEKKEDAVLAEKFESITKLEESIHARQLDFAERKSQYTTAQNLAEQLSAEYIETTHISEKIGKYKFIICAVSQEKNKDNSSISMTPELAHNVSEGTVIYDFGAPPSIKSEALEILKSKNVTVIDNNKAQELMNKAIASREGLLPQVNAIIGAEMFKFLKEYTNLLPKPEVGKTCVDPCTLVGLCERPRAEMRF